MIPVQLQPEPEGFHDQVRKPGHEWLENNGIDINSMPPASTELPPHWRKFSQEIWDAYDGVCAYLAIYFEFATGASSIDHFIPKSRHAGGAYEWNNYRLSCLSMNRNKNNFQGIIDPIGMKEGVFWLNFVSGEIYPSSNLNTIERDLAEITVKRLDLNSPKNRHMRVCHFEDCRDGKISLDYLRRKSPFVWSEAVRQDLL